MQAVAAEFNTPITAFLVRSGPIGAAAGAGAAQFRIRWFTPVREVICFRHKSSTFLLQNLLALV